MIKNCIKHNKAVSEVFGTILLLLISVMIFSVVIASLSSFDGGPAPPSVALVGSIQNNNLVISHNGGQGLDLNTKILIRPYTGSNDSYSLRASDYDYLDNLSKNDSRWNIGEKLNFNLSSLSFHQQYEPLEVLVLDLDSKSIIMSGVVQETRYADISLSVDVSNINPNPEEEVTIYVNATNLGPSEAEGVIVKIDLPDGLFHISNTTNGFGNYSDTTGLWDIGFINKSQTATLQIKAIPLWFKKEKTKLIFIIDGSDAITDDEFFMVKYSIYNAIMNGDIPHDKMGGLVELSVLQYGYSQEASSYSANIEINKKLITPDNYGEVALDVLLINKSGGGLRPLAHAIRTVFSVLTPITDAYYSYDMENYNYRKVVNLVIGRDPNVGYPEPSSQAATTAWSCAVIQRDFLIRYGRFIDGRDEFDVEAIVGNANDLDTDILKNRIIFPPTGVILPSGESPSSPGWVKLVKNQADLEDSIKSQFDMVFGGGTIVAELESTDYRDPNSSNNMAKITIVPKWS